MRKILVALMVLVSVSFASGEITKVDSYGEGGDLYFSTQLWNLAQVVSSKKEEAIQTFHDMMSSTTGEAYEKNYKGLPCSREFKVLKAENLKEDTLKLIDLGVVYISTSYWGGKSGGGSTQWLLWKEGENIYCYEVIYNRTRGIGL